jgi:cytidylate kinase
MASRLAAHAGVRSALVDAQRSLAAQGPVVAEGRDLGTVVFPRADVKIYLDADLETRARRRYHELSSRGIALPYDEVLADLERRDRRDRSRPESPLRAADDAVVIDTTGMGVAEQVEAVVRAVGLAGRAPGSVGGNDGEQAGSGGGRRP